jgi:hypothetical protein
LPDPRAGLDRFIGGYDDMYNMTKAAKRRVPQKEVTARQPVVVTASVIVLAALVLICTAMLAPPLSTAVVEAWQFRPSGQQCSILKDAAARRACYEKLSAQASRYPLIGANAPPILPPSGQRSE